MELMNIRGAKILLNEHDGTLHVQEPLTYEKTSAKRTLEMQPLLYAPQAAGEEISYRFYMNIWRKEDADIFRKRGMSNGITILMPGTIEGECRKNSGHYHCLSEGHRLPYPEVYEILCGEAMFLLQKSECFQKDDFTVEDCRAVLLKKGEKLIIPPYYAHCAINIGDGYMAFGNLAVPCPLNYAAIRQKCGFFTYVLKKNNTLLLLQNPHYESLPLPKITEPREQKTLGLDFSKTLYDLFMEQPCQFDYLDHPEAYEEAMQQLLTAQETACNR
ncbi:hypothetical protein DWW36_01350 [Erysipelotrichaceae bacterium AF15-26LB]|nr:hypothetical protein [[Clostridium] innocuum]RJV92210.1 hypothetical protein DWX45_04815 [Erysipelotrichaceae bacterium AF19-24AC]RJV93089.1 hypothetical protein DWW36_01350 [Erysipelotrichaceae bacterium AF15-26LB]